MTATSTARLAPWDPSAAHRFVTADGTALHVDDTGPGGADSGGLTLVLVHGWTLDHTEWDKVIAALADVLVRPARIIRYDHRGHGGSAPAPTGTATVEQAADDLAELMTARVPDGPIVLVGHSMGGLTIMALAERHPELLPRIRGAVFVATTSGDLDKLTFGLPRWCALVVSGIEGRVNRRMLRLRRRSLLRKPGIARPGLRWLVFGRRPRRADVQDAAGQLGRCHPASMAGFRRSMTMQDRRADLAALRGRPTVVLAGGADRLLPVSHSRIIAEELGCELVIYPDAGHMLNVERTDGVVERIAETLARVNALA